MTEEEYRQMAKEAGYSEDEIEELVDFQKESELPFDALPLIDRRVD